MKLKVISLFISFFILISFANAKPMPPGTGNSVPANILFLVDKSQSMHNSASGKIANALRPPTDVVGNGTGNYFISGIDESGFYYMNADQNKKVSNNNVFKGVSSRAHGLKNRNLGSPVQIEYYPGNNKIYVLADQRLRSHGGNCRYGGFILYTVNPKIAVGGKNSWPNGSVAHWNVNKFPTNLQIGQFPFRKNCNSAPKDSRNKKAISITGSTSMAIHNNRLYVVSADTPNYPNYSAMWVLDLNTGLNADGWGKGRFCNTNGKGTALTKYRFFDEAIDVVTEGSQVFMYSKDSSNGKAQIFKTALDSSGCIVDQWDKDPSPLVLEDRCGDTRGNGIVVRNGEIFTTGFYSHSVCKYNQSTFVSKVGVDDAFTENTAANPDLYINYPTGIDFGRGAGQDNTLFVVSQGRLEVTMINPTNMTYVDHFGDPGVSRFQGVKEAISYVLNDSATLQQANFGIGFWFGGSGRFRGFNSDSAGNLEYDSPKECNKNACIRVGVNPKGAQQILELFNRDTIKLQYGTKSGGFRNLLHDYFIVQKYPVTAYNQSVNCQTTAVIIIGDGAFTDAGGLISNVTLSKIQEINKLSPNVLTFAVGYGSDVINNNKARTSFQRIAVKGGTEKPPNQQGVFYAETSADLKKVTDTIVQNIISRQVVFSAPSIASEIKRSGELFQAKFQNRTNKEWYGTVLKTTLLGDGSATTSKQEWNAATVMPLPTNRKIWTALPGDTSINNFNANNVSQIRNLLNLQGNVINEYHRKTTGSFPSRLARCSSKALDGTIGDEDVGLINFVRGEDYFDYDADCILNEVRTRIDEKNKEVDAYLADIYNSTLLIVGPPKASMSTSSQLTEAHFRKMKQYGNFVNSNSNRKEIVYGAANNGILHAFDSSTGKEVWGFVPPLVIPKLPTVINGSLNTKSGGGSAPRFILDGSPVAHDTYFKHPIHNKEDWYTLLMIPYGRAAAGFSLIDVTDVNAPLHLYSILNDPIGKKIHRVDENGNLNSYAYKSTRLYETDFKEVQNAKSNATLGRPNVCNNGGTTSCYEGKTFTLVGQSLMKSDLTIFINGSDKTVSTTVTRTGGNTVFKFPVDVTHNANAGGVVDKIAIVEVGDLPIAGIDYDYRYLGETWSSPRVFRMPSGPGDKNVMDDEYVAVLSGGNGNFNPTIGSNIYVIDWLTGKVKKEIKISDKNNDIVNSVPATPVVVTADLSQEEYSGALVYASDLEGKITKINLSSLSGTFTVNTSGNVLQSPPTNNSSSSTTSTSGIQLYDNYTFFDIEASTQTNNRYMYHSLDAGIGVKSKKFWLFGGTGDYLNLNDTMVDFSKVKNVMFGLKDPFFPGFGNATTSGGAPKIEKLSDCKNRTDQANSDCPDTSDSGWYVELDKQKKVTAEPTLTGNVVYYPVYKPSRSVTECGSGSAYICAYDADCGKNISSDLGQNTAAGHTNENCYYVGTGVLSKIISFGTKLYANISGESTNIDKNDIVVINAINTGLVNYRSSWRDNF